MRRKRGDLFIGLGLVLLGAALLVLWNNVRVSNQADQSAQNIVSQLELHIPDTPDLTLLHVYPEREMPTMEIEGYRYIGTLEIPFLELTLPIMEEWDDVRLKVAPCRYAGNVYQDNMVVAAHNYKRHFGQLKSLPLGSEIIFTDMEGNRYSYSVAWMETLQALQKEEMVLKTQEPGTDWDLTLFTCTVGGGSRYTIRCIRMD